MLKLPYTKSSDGLLETSFIVLSYKDGRVKLAFVFQRYMIPMIPKSESHAHILFYILKFSQSLRDRKRRSQMFHPTFKNMLLYMTS